MFNHLCASIPK